MIFLGLVSPDGTLELDHPELYSDLLKGKLANYRVQLDIDRKKTPRSQQQSAYLFAAVYPPIAKHTGHAATEVHEICKQTFLPPRQLSIGNQTVSVEAMLCGVIDFLAPLQKGLIGYDEQALGIFKVFLG